MHSMSFMSLREVLEGIPVINAISPTHQFAQLNAKFIQPKTFSDRLALEIRLQSAGKNATRVTFFCRPKYLGEVKFTRSSLYVNEVDAWLLETSTLIFRLDFSTHCRKKIFAHQHRLVILSSRTPAVRQQRRLTPHVQLLAPACQCAESRKRPAPLVRPETRCGAV